MNLFNNIKIHSSQLLKFGIVGAFGTAINFIIYFISSHIFNLGINISSICAFMVAVSHNYALNHLWTFRTENKHKPINFRQFYYYFLGNIRGLLINLTVLNAVTIIAGVDKHIWGQLGGILAGMLSNYVYSKNVVFPRLLVHKKKQVPSKYIQLFFITTFLGFYVASGFHAILNTIGMEWPWNSFLFSPSDRFNDWHSSVAQAASPNPYYHKSHTLATYFPLTYVLLKVGAGFNEITRINIYFIISLALITLTVGLTRAQIQPPHTLSKENQLIDTILLILACVISYPVMFAIDRGNIDLWIALLSTLFVVTQHTHFKLLGLISLSIAIALKGYPLAFLLLLIREKNYKSALGCLLFVSLMSIATLYFMWDNFEKNLHGFIYNLQEYYKNYVIGNLSLFASSDPYNAIRIVYFYATDNWPSSTNKMENVSISILKIYSLFSTLFAIVTTFFILAIPSSHWQKVTAICLIALLFPNVCNDYKLCFLFPGLFSLLLCNINTSTEKISFVLFCSLMIPKSYFFIHGKPISMLINPILLIALAYQVIGNHNHWRAGIKILNHKIHDFVTKHIAA